VTRVALDTSAAVPLLLKGHHDHDRLRVAVGGLQISLTGHSLAETYSVLTRLPGDARVGPSDAARLLSAGFLPALLIDATVAANLPTLLATAGISGGAVYDALVGLAIVGTGATLLTRDQRAASTYAALGIAFDFV